MNHSIPAVIIATSAGHKTIIKDFFRLCKIDPPKRYFLLFVLRFILQ